jgi:hypothetical protein
MVAGKQVNDSEKEASANFMNLAFQAGLLLSIAFSVAVYFVMSAGSSEGESTATSCHIFLAFSLFVFSPEDKTSDDDKWWCAEYDDDNDKCHQWCGNRWGEENPPS